MSPRQSQEVVLVEQIEPRIVMIRGQRVILDADSRGCTESLTKRLNEQVRRNQGRFPADFAWPLTIAERARWSQIATTSRSEILHMRCPVPSPSTGGADGGQHIEHAPAMEVSVYVVRAFVELRDLVSTHKDLAGKLADLEHKVSSHDSAIQSLVAAIRQLMALPRKPRGTAIGFHTKREARRSARSSA